MLGLEIVFYSCLSIPNLQDYDYLHYLTNSATGGTPEDGETIVNYGETLQPLMLAVSDVN